MKTQDWIAALARGAEPVPKAAVARRLLPAGLLAFCLSLAGALVIARLVAPDIMGAWGWWLKMAYGASLALAAAWGVSRLARPGAAARGAWAAIASTVGVVMALGLAELLAAPPQARMTLWLGHSWMECPRNVVLLSLPALVASFWVLKSMAPTRPAVAGAVAGVFAGAVGAVAYGMVCSEISLVFVASWYTLGIGAAGLLGALLGPRLLRW